MLLFVILIKNCILIAIVYRKMTDLSSSSPTEESSEFRYLPELDFLLKQIAPSTSTTCEVINVKPLDNFIFQPKQKSAAPREMRSRQHLQYEVIRTFNDANEFDQWWNHEGGSQGWIFNTIYKVSYFLCKTKLFIVQKINFTKYRVIHKF